MKVEAEEGREDFGEHSWETTLGDQSWGSTLGGPLLGNHFWGNG